MRAELRALILDTLPARADELAKVCGCTNEAVGQYMRYLTSKEVRACFVLRWERKSGVGPMLRVYAQGDRPDAIRPPWLTKAEKDRRIYVKEKRGKELKKVLTSKGPFAALFQR